MVYAIALDPGGTTGVAIVRDPDQPWSIVVDQLTGDHYMELFRMLYTLEPEYIICESFENRGQSNTLLTSMEYIGVVKLYIQRTGTIGVWQSASTGKAFWTDAALKKYGLYVPGLKHARDAIRHYAAWQTFANKDRSLLQDSAVGSSVVVRGAEAID
jgi:hypothetical protein